MSRKRVAVLVVLVSLLTVFAILDLEARGVLEPVIVPSLEQSFSYVEGAMRGNEVYVAAAALFVLLVILISRNPPWLPTGYLWVEWGRWQKIGKHSKQRNKHNQHRNTFPAHIESHLI